MTYDLHPIFVHFPIALLVIYSIIEILPLSKWFPRVAWKDIARVLLVVGLLGGFAALATGDTAEHLSRPNRQLVNMHSLFAGTSIWLYAALLIGEIAAYVSTKAAWLTKLGKTGTAIILFIKRFLSEGLISKSIVLLALIAISVTGLLGGVMVYGVTADPLANIVLKILGISL